jgi:hypothetical protein
MNIEQNAVCQKINHLSVQYDVCNAVSFSPIELCLQQMKNKASEYLKYKKISF